jgi:hypothetical protein
VSAQPIDPGDPIWEDHRLPAERWSDTWAQQARRHPSVARQGFVFTRSQCELSDAEIRSRVRRRIWWVPRWGVLSVIHPGNDARVAAVLRATGAALVGPGAVISHESAAALYGIDVLHRPSAAIVTVADETGGRRAGVDRHNAALARAETFTWYGTQVTSPARTVADIARRGRLAGLITADAALREELASRAGIADAIFRQIGWPGARSARWVIDHANGLSESPLESLVRGRLIEAGRPAPELQVEIAGTGARVDMLYRASGLVIEADGLGKYANPEVLRAEKRRQVRLERAGLRVIRVLWEEVIGDASEFIRAVDQLTR